MSSSRGSGPRYIHFAGLSALHRRLVGIDLVHFEPQRCQHADQRRRPWLRTTSTALGACRVAVRSLTTPAGLRPELVPIVEVEKVLPTANNPAVLEFEDDAAVCIQALARSLR